MLLKFYSKNNTFKDVLENAKDLCIEHSLDLSDKTLSFECQWKDIKNMAETEGYIETPDDIFVIKEIIRDSQNTVAQVFAQLNFEDLEGKAFKRFESVGTQITETLQLAFAGTGWTIGTCTVTKRRTVRMENSSALAVLKQALKTFRAEITVDSKAKRIDIYEKIGTDKGVYFISDLNLKRLETQQSTYDFYTEIQGFGDENLSTPVLTNYTYSTKKKRFLWKDERYTILENLTEDAQAKLDDMAKPYVSYTGDLLDLANMSDDYDFLAFKLGDVIWLVDDNTDVKEQQRIVGLKVYPEEPERSSFTLANKVLTFDEMTEKYDEAAATIDNITADNGTISGSSIDYISSEQISDLNDGIIDSAAFGYLSAEIISAKEISATEITAVRAQIGELTANSGTFEELSAKIFQADTAQITDLIATNISGHTAQITTLESNYANIANLLAGNAGVGELQNIHLTSNNAVIDTALVRNLVSQNITVNDLLAGEIDTSKFHITSGDGAMTIEGATQQFYDDEGNLRIQIGKDAIGNFNFIVYTKDGTGQLINEDGITASAISDGLIVNQMVADNAGISGSKLDIESVVRTINGASTSIDMDKIYYSPENKSLVQLYTQMTSSISSISSEAQTASANAQQALEALDGISTLNSMAIQLSKDVHVVHTDYQGNNGNFSNAVTTVKVYLGEADITSQATISYTRSTGLTGSWNSTTKTFTVTGMTVDEGYVEFRATYNSTTITKRFTITKIYDGKAGYTYDLNVDPALVRKAANGALTPDTINISAKSYTGDTSAAYMGIIVIEASTNGTTYTEVYRSASAEAQKQYIISDNTVRTFRISLVNPLNNLVLCVKSVLIIADVENLQTDVLNITNRVSNIETSIDGLNVDISDMQTQIYGLADGSLLVHVDLEKTSTSRIYRAHVYSGLKEVTEDYPATSYLWTMETAEGDTYLGTGYSVTIANSRINRDGCVKLDFVITDTAYLLTPDGKYIKTPDNKSLMIYVEDGGEAG